MWFVLIAMCLYFVYYAQGMGLPSQVRFFKLKKGVWVFRAAITVMAVLIALSLSEKGTDDAAQFFAMFALANSLALPYKRNAVPKGSGFSIWDNLRSKIGFSIGSALFLLIISFIAVIVAGWMRAEEYWYSLVIFIGAIGLHVNETGLTAMYENMRLSKIASLDIEHRNKVLIVACMAYLIACILIAYLLFSNIELEFRNWTGWTGLLGGAIIGGLFELD